MGTAAAPVRLDTLNARLGEGDFQRLADLIEGHSGIRMPPVKRTMVEGRLRRRLRALGLGDFSEYCDLLFHREGLADEITFLIDAITTNKTEFFREAKHFEILTTRVLPGFLANDAEPGRPFRVWSAGSSIGCEAYTLAMVLSDARGATPGFDFRILATDICTDVLAAGRRAVYPEEMVEPVPMDLRKRYLLRSRDRRQRQVRMTPEIRRTVQFRHLNFMDRTYDIREVQDVVFCRNVIIYFDRPTRQAVLERICRHLAPGGTLFMGHSENLGDLTLPVCQIAPTVYQKLQRG